MLLSIGAKTALRSPRPTVFAYDMASPRRARRVHKLLSSLRVHAQLSVFETRLTHAVFKDVLAELHALCDSQADRLAVWWPREGACVELCGASRRIRSPLGYEPASCKGLNRCLGGCGNFMVCYDVADAVKLQRVHAIVASRSLAVQRSVFWMRSSLAGALDMLELCQRTLGEDDRVWVHPLRNAGDLWRLGDQASSMLPVARHHWA